MQAPPQGAAAGDGAVPTKACSKCKEVKPCTNFWKDPTKKSGYTSWCKQCFSQSAERRKLEGPPVLVTERECSICKQRKPADAFMKDSRRITGLDARCRECRRAQHAARKQRNIEAGNQAWEEKECKRCHIVKPASEFKRHAYTASGLDSWCKACCRERRKELMAQKSAQAAAADAGGEHSTGSDGGAGEPTVSTKECISCKEVLPAADFARDRSQTTGLSRRCKGCEKDYRRSKRQCTTPPSPASPVLGGLALSAPAPGASILAAADTLQQLLAPLQNRASGPSISASGLGNGSWPASPSAASASAATQFPWSSTTPTTAAAAASMVQQALAPPRTAGRVSAFAAGAPTFPSFLPPKQEEASTFGASGGVGVSAFAPVGPASGPMQITGWAGPSSPPGRTAAQLPAAAPLDLGPTWRNPPSFSAGVAPGVAPGAPSLPSRLSAPPAVQGGVSQPQRGEPGGSTLDGLFPSDMWTDRQDSLTLLPGLMATDGLGLQDPGRARRVDSLLGTYLPTSNGGVGNGLPGAERGTSFSFSLLPSASRGESLLGNNNNGALRLDSLVDFVVPSGAGGFDSLSTTPGLSRLGTLPNSTSAPALVDLNGQPQPATGAALREASLLRALAAPSMVDTPMTAPAPSRLGMVGEAPRNAMTATRKESLFEVNLDGALKYAEDIVLPTGGAGASGGAGRMTSTAVLGVGDGTGGLDLERFNSLGLANDMGLPWTQP